MKINKIYILGTSGSGKTTLAKEISIKTKIIHYDLDDISWEKKWTKKYPYDIRLKKLKEILNKDSWIIEGVYGSWVRPAIVESDIVLFLLLPTHTLIWRIFKRAFMRGKTQSLIETLKLIFYVINYRISKKGHTCYNSHLNLLEKNNVKYYVIRKNRDIEKIKKLIY